MDRNARLAVERGGDQQRKRVIKDPDAKDPALHCPLRGLPYSFHLAAVCWSDGVVESMKSQTPSTKSQGVRCQGRRTKKLKPETSAFVVWHC